MDRDDLKTLLREILSKGLLVDLVDAITARALAAHTMIRDHAHLDPKRARQVEGRVRFPMQEHSFHHVCLLHGGIELNLDTLPGTNLKVFQPFMRFNNAKHGVILGFAAISDPSMLPTKNLSRGAGVSLNYHVQDRLDLYGDGPKVGDIFVLFLAARDRWLAGAVKEIAVGVIDAAYEEYLYYETIEDFIASYTDPSSADEADPVPQTGLVTLKKQVTPFKAPESEKTDDEAGDSDETSKG
jgi:hypothetical protein